MHLLSRAALVSSILAIGTMSLAPLVSASQVQEVLGDKTDVSQMQFPGLAAGPGFILPDSSLYSVDQLVQELRLLLAFVPEQQAVVQKNILGERLAEARVEVSRGNLQATEVALAGAEKAARGLSQAVSDASAHGRGSAELARSLNQTLGEYRTVLDEAANSAPLALAYRLDATSQTLLETKLRVEDELPGDEVAQAINDDVQSVTDREVLGVQTTANSILQKLGFLSASQHASPVAQEHASSNSAVKGRDGQQGNVGIKTTVSDERVRLLDERKKILEQIKLLMQQLQSNQRAYQQLQKMQGQVNSSLSGTPTPPPDTGNPTTDANNSVTSTASVSPSSLETSCPAKFTFTGTISAPEPMTISYRWYRSDGAIGPVSSLVFSESGSKTVDTTWTLGSNTSTRFQPFNGWEAIRILSPVSATSNEASFTLNCVSSETSNQ